MALGETYSPQGFQYFDKLISSVEVEVDDGCSGLQHELVPLSGNLQVARQVFVRVVLKVAHCAFGASTAGATTGHGFSGVETQAGAASVGTSVAGAGAGAGAGSAGLSSPKSHEPMP